MAGLITARAALYLVKAADTSMSGSLNSSKECSIKKRIFLMRLVIYLKLLIDCEHQQVTRQNHEMEIGKTHISMIGIFRFTASFKHLSKRFQEYQSGKACGFVGFAFCLFTFAFLLTSSQKNERHQLEYPDVCTKQGIQESQLYGG